MFFTFSFSLILVFDVFFGVFFFLSLLSYFLQHSSLLFFTLFLYYIFFILVIFISFFLPFISSFFFYFSNFLSFVTNMDIGASVCVIKFKTQFFSQKQFHCILVYKQPYRNWDIICIIFLILNAFTGIFTIIQIPSRKLVILKKEVYMFALICLFLLSLSLCFLDVCLLYSPLHYGLEKGMNPFFLYIWIK